jgi:hypothetical protein
MKTRSFVAGLITALSTGAYGTQINPTPISELVAKAEYILVGTIVKVDIIDHEGHELSDPKSRTGPGEGNTIRYHVIVDRGNTIKGNRKNIPRQLIVPKWPRWHATLENETPRVEGKTFIFLLAGKDFAPVSAPESVREMSKRETIEKLVK